MNTIGWRTERARGNNGQIELLTTTKLNSKQELSTHLESFRCDFRIEKLLWMHNPQTTAATTATTSMKPILTLVSVQMNFILSAKKKKNQFDEATHTLAPRAQSRSCRYSFIWMRIELKIHFGNDGDEKMMYRSRRFSDTFSLLSPSPFAVWLFQILASSSFPPRSSISVLDRSGESGFISLFAD